MRYGVTEEGSWDLIDHLTVQGGIRSRGLNLSQQALKQDKR